MQKKPRTIYEAARFNAGLKREDAAELLKVSYESVRDFENGKTVPHSSYVVEMMKIYQSPWLGWMYLKETNEVAKACLPDIELQDLSTALLMIQRETAHIKNVMPDMVEACSDGQITDDEQDKHERGITEIKHWIAAGLAYIFAPLVKQKPPALTSRRFLG